MFANHSTILFQGDSITDGGRSRDNDLNHVMGHGYGIPFSTAVSAQTCIMHKVKKPKAPLGFLYFSCSAATVFAYAPGIGLASSHTFA
jgi:hypothetical protein